jgi:hypothetical protein
VLAEEMTPFTSVPALNPSGAARSAYAFALFPVVLIDPATSQPFGEANGECDSKIFKVGAVAVLFQTEIESILSKRKKTEEKRNNGNERGNGSHRAKGISI